MSIALFSCVRRLVFLSLGLAAAGFTLRAQTPTAIDGFNPDVDGNVFALVTQADGKLLIGGQFTAVGSVPRANLARLNVDGSLDTTFNPNANGPVRAIVLQTDGKIVIGGDFTSLQPNATGTAVARGCIARLNADGSVDTSLAVSIGKDPVLPLNPQVFALAVQADGAIVVGGSFSVVSPGTGFFNRKNIFRITPSGSVDLGFDPTANAMVLALAIHVDNKIVVGGAFTSLWPAGDAVPSTRNRIARLNPNGTVDSEFNPNANNGVNSLAVQRDGKILLGGFFTTLQPIGEEGPANRPHFARLNPNGSIDSEFFPHAEGNVTAIALQPDGSTLIGGSFTAVWGRGASSVSRTGVARFNPDGSVDVDFAPTINGETWAFAFQPDGKVVIGGSFTRVQPAGASTGIVRNHLARLNTDGSFDASFALDAGGRILASITQADGKVVIAGTFTSVGGATHNYLARLNADGTIDATYNPDLNGRVYTMAYETSSNKVIIGGAFTTIGGEPRNHIARLNPSGTIDSEFNPNIDGQVGVITLQSDGRMLVGGTFANVNPLGSTASTPRSNLLRLNANGTLDTAFDPSPNSTVAAITLQSDGKILIGGLFSALTPGFATNTSAATTTRGFIARLNADGTIDTVFAPTINAQISSIVVQADGKIVIAGAFTTTIGSDNVLDTVTNADGTKTNVAPTRNHIARLEADGKLDKTYDPNANNNVLTMALQSDGKLIIGGAFTTLQPNGASNFTLRKYAARLNADGTVDSAFNLDISELPGNRVDSIRIQANDGRVLVGGAFTSLQPATTPARVTRNNFVRLNSNLSVDTAFDPGTGGSTGAIVNGLAIQPDNKLIAVGNFSDLGGAKSTNIARFRSEGGADPEFSNTVLADGPVNAVAVRPNVAPVPSQLAGFAWLNANGTLRTAFATGRVRLSGEVAAIAVDDLGRVLLGGSFTNLDNTTAGNLVRLNADGSIDTGFSPSPGGRVTGIAIQRDRRIVIVGTFTTLKGDVVRNHIARIDDDGSVDVTFDPNANGPINAIVIESDNRMIVGGAFTSFTPNASTDVITRNNIARINFNGTIDAYDPNINANVNALTLQSDGKVIAGGAFSTVQPNGGTTAFTRNFLLRLNTDGSLDQNFDPNPNAVVYTLASLANGQIVVGGAFTTLQPNGGSSSSRSNLARVNSDGAVDQSFNPNPNAAVTTLSLQPNGAVVIGGIFSALQPNATGAAVTRNLLARVNADGSLDVDFNPDVNGPINTLLARPDGTVLVGGRFTSLELFGAIVIGGNFASVGGVNARNLAMLNDNGSVNTTFQPRPDAPVNALLLQADGKLVAGGAFTNIAGTARSRLARFNADGTLDTSFNPPGDSVVLALAALPDGKILAGGRSAGTVAGGSLVRLNANGSVDATFPSASVGLGVRAIAVQPDGRILVVVEGSGVRNTLMRLTADGAVDASFTPLASGSSFIDALALQADGRILVSGDFSVGSSGISRLARLEANGTLDASFNPAPNGRVTALTLQSDGRVVIGGGFNVVAGQSRVGIARVTNTSPGTQSLGVAANRSSVTWMRGGTTGEIAAAIFELSTDRVTWTTLGNGTRVAGTANWQLTGLNLPASGLFYIRARALVPSGGTSSGIYESVREFTFTNPIPSVSGGATTVPATAASSTIFDPVTGISPRAVAYVVPGEGTVEIVAAGSQPESGGRPVRLANLSTRGRVSSGNPLILGFAVSGTEQRPLLVRAIGPALAGFGVSGALPATRLQVYDNAGRIVAENEGWGNSSAITQTSVATGAFPLAAGSADSAAIVTLAPGNYTMQVVDTRGNGGIGLAEIYDAGSGDGARLVNVSSRAAAGTGSDALISGFVIAGDGSQHVLLRGIGPGLARFGATGLVADPSVALFDGTGLELGSNDNWVSSVTTVSSAATSAGAFALDAGSKDAAVLATLPSGAYTIQVRAGAGGAGNALLEIYEVR